MSYKKVIGKNGKELYYRNGKLIKKQEVPDDVVLPVVDYSEKEPIDTSYDSMMMDGVSVQDNSPNQPPKVIIEDPVAEPEEPVVYEAPKKVCLFCEGIGGFTRMVNGTLVYLCQDDYMAKTLGEVAQQLREGGTKV